MTASSDDNVYIKRGRKYVPFGVRYNEGYLPDGIWYVRHFDNSYGHTNVDHYLSGLYKVGETPEYPDIPKLCSLHSYVEYVMASPEFKEILNSHQYSFLELTSKITALVIKLNKQIRDDDNKRPERHSGTL